MESDPNQMSQSPTLCRSGCGFYGNAAFDGMCSMCYKEAVKRKQAAPTGAPSSLVSEPLSSFAVPSSATSSTPSGSSSTSSSNTLPASSSSNVSAISAQVFDAQVEEQMEPEPTATTITSLVVPSSAPSLAIAADESASSIVAEALSAIVTNTTTTTTNYETEASVASEAVSAPSAEPEKKKKKKTRCALCRANVGVISFPCRCGLIFCGSHRYAKEHNCTFDYKEHGAEEIRKNNPQIIGEKIQKI